MTTRRAKLSQVQIVSYILLTTGVFFILASFFSNSSIGALIGLGLTFWGALLLYIKPGDLTIRNLVEAAVSPSFATLAQLVQELGYQGDITYLPPGYFTNPETTKICITKDKNGNLPTPEQTRLHENKPVSLTPQAIFLAPSGIQLSSMIEKAFGEKFIKTSLESLQQKLPKVFREDLEIAENLELQTTENIQIQAIAGITEKAWHKQDHSQMIFCHKCEAQLEAGSKFCRVCGTQVAQVAAEPPRRLSPQTAQPTSVRNMAIKARITHPADGLTFREALLVDCPIFSAIAIAITKATGKPVRISDTKAFENGEVVETYYSIMEE